MDRNDTGSRRLNISFEAQVIRVAEISTNQHFSGLRVPRPPICERHLWQRLHHFFCSLSDLVGGGCYLVSERPNRLTTAVRLRRTPLRTGVRQK
jgi:hypothetical protein